jgi:DNA helicase-2/ATP-dependent DNA helicase PcrA
MAPRKTQAQPKPEERQPIDYKALLNEAQLKAVMHRDGPHLVIAGAGTGKTRTLVYRLAYLVEHGIPPHSILLLTFTRKAAQEMMHRASEILDERCGNVFGGTFHSFGNMILRRYGSHLGYAPSFTILDRSDAEEILGLLRTEMGYQSLKTQFPRKEALMTIASRSVNTGKSIAQIVKEEYTQFAPQIDGIFKVSEEYARYKLDRSLMDYDDLLVNLTRLLREQEHLRVRLSETYRYIMVDEYQDTNRIQAEIVRLLASKHGNVMVVGDDSQSIYSFRGADFRNIMDFPKLFPGCAVTTLEQNYRSGQAILSLTNAIIAHAREKYSKHLFSDIETSAKPFYFRPKSENHQARFVCREIAGLLRQGAKLGDIAVLFRSGWHSNDLEVELSAHGIPFVKHGGIKFVEASHIKDVLALLRISLNPMDSVAWHRVLKLIPGIGGVTAAKIVKMGVDEGLGYNALVAKDLSKKKYTGQLQGLYDLLADVRAFGADLSAAVGKVLEFYKPYFKEQYEDHKDRANDLVSLFHIAERYASLDRLLSDLTLESPEKSGLDESAEGLRDKRLVLSTIHSAKGLEWDTVFLIHLVDGCLPSSYSMVREESIEEERRLFYVAATRAKRGLYLVAPMLQGNNYYSSFGGPSRFLYEIKDLGRLTRRVT